MAKQRYGINDAYQGTVGTVIGYEWRGKWCLRARPRMVRNPRTEAQQVNREVFKCVVREAGRLKGLLRMGLRALALEMHLTEGNLFVKRNKQCFWLDGEGVLQADWEQVLVADGPVVPVADPVVETRHAVAAVETKRAASPHATMNVAPPVETRHAASPENTVADRETQHAASLRRGLDGDADRETRHAASLQAGSGGNELAVSFRPSAEGEAASGEDEVYLAAYCPELGEATMSGSVWRKKGRVDLSLPPCW